MNISAISAGNGSIASELSSPYNLASRAANFSASTFLESITTVAVGLKPATSTGVQVTSQEKVTASGLSLTVA